MSHQVLARKWRPRDFAHMVGQEHVVRALANALAQGRLHHAYLFTGTRGVGKTTLARILAKCLNCETGITPEPCGTCTACREIDGGRFVDLIEIDAASYTGIDNMREVLENAQYAPTAGRYKVYIIDEVHQLSRHAFNAMLKTLEEPPGHVIFILATTDPQKVPVTVLSRCLQFNLKQMPTVQVSGHLRRVLEAEGVPCEPGALTLLARAAAGSMRDALSLADQAIAYGGGQVREVETRAMLGVIDQAYLLPLLEALAAADGPRLMREADALAARGVSFDAALQDLAGLLHQIALARSVPEAVGEDLPDRERLFALARQLDEETIQLHYQIATLGRRDLEWAPDEHAGFSMTLLRMLAFQPADAPAPRARAPVAGGGVAAQGQEAAGVMQAALPTGIAAANEAEVVPPAPPVLQDWRALAESLPGLVRQLAMQCELVSRVGPHLRLRLPEQHKPLLGSLADKLREALADRLGEAVRVDFELVPETAASPAAARAREQAARQEAAQAAMRDDPFVQTLIRECEATLGNVRPLSDPARPTGTHP